MASTSPLSTSPIEAPTGPIALAGAPRPAGAPKPKPRKRVNTAEKRHQHNAIERQRRETLNSKFLVLARLLPSLAACRRPSKSAIVNGSISHLSHQRSQRLLAAKLLRQMAAEREELLAEVNQWRQANGCQPKTTASPWAEEAEEVYQVEKETFGSFASMGGEGGDDQDDQDDEPQDSSSYSDSTMNIEKANLVVGGSFSTGLITPRSSTDMGSTMESSMFAKPAAMSWTGSNFTMAPTMPFNAFMPESADTSSIPSPVGSSSHHSTILTPPSVEQGNMYTMSPASSASPEDTTQASRQPAAQQQQQWTPQQLAFFQQQVQHQQLQRQQQAALAAFAAQPQDMNMGNMFMPNQQLAPQQANLAQLMAMLPQHQQQQQQQQAAAAQPEQIDQWRKLVLGGLLAQTQQADASKLGQGFGFGLQNGWSEQTVGV
ncbi:uncharacterized protein EHS24_003115 [Apiotrichum porosum]|uniref:BHLH domain-containing protein n=1 Tax=Apiotrichum porosum TaxID=105984 RepID=A0A427XFD1_9TREE|nr:uncharacterized protein EHS24_003115 [Apiotrichum porosum]RSH77558.1 hypothetical protein EHS24_003115 [Apiotrichum porosum]